MISMYEKNKVSKKKFCILTFARADRNQMGSAIALGFIDDLIIAVVVVFVEALGVAFVVVVAAAASVLEDQGAPGLTLFLLFHAYLDGK